MLSSTYLTRNVVQYMSDKKCYLVHIQLKMVSSTYSTKSVVQYIFNQKYCLDISDRCLNIQLNCISRTQTNGQKKILDVLIFLQSINDIDKAVDTDRHFKRYQVFQGYLSLSLVKGRWPYRITSSVHSVLTDITHCFRDFFAQLFTPEEISFQQPIQQEMYTLFQRRFQTIHSLTS